MFFINSYKTNSVAELAVIAAFGLTTVSTNIPDSHTANPGIKLIEMFENTYKDSRGETCICSSIYDDFQGDYFNSFGSEENFHIRQNQKTQVRLRITKIKKHVSSFDFEDVFEEF